MVSMVGRLSSFSYHSSRITPQTRGSLGAMVTKRPTDSFSGPDVFVFFFEMNNGVITTPGSASYDGKVNDGSNVRLGLCAFNVSIAVFIGMPSLTPTTSMNPAL